MHELWITKLMQVTVYIQLLKDNFEEIVSTFILI